MPKTHVTIPFFIPHHGCRHRCVFCNQVYTSNTQTLPDKTYIIQKIEKYLKTIQPTVSHIEVAFFGGSFTGLDTTLQKEYLSIAYRYLALKHIHGIRLSTRPDYIDTTALLLLKEFGVTTVEIGAQSMHDDILQLSNRGHTVADTITACSLLQEYGFNCIIQLMPGLPGDSWEKSIETAHKVVVLNPDGVRIYPTVVIKDTHLQKMYYEGTFKPLDLDTAVSLCAQLYEIFISHNIPVIRIGLHPFDSKVTNTIIAGPYHPSFGYLVKSRYYRNVLKNKIEEFTKTRNKGTIKIKLPLYNIAEYYGHKKDNIIFLKDAFPAFSLHFEPCAINEPVLILE